MPIKVLPFRNYRLQAVSLVHFFLLFFHKNNLGTGLLECIVSSIKWKIYFISLLFGHTVIYHIFMIVKKYIIIHYKNIFLIGFLVEIFIFQSNLLCEPKLPQEKIETFSSKTFLRIFSVFVFCE